MFVIASGCTQQGRSQGTTPAVAPVGAAHTLNKEGNNLQGVRARTAFQLKDQMVLYENGSAEFSYEVVTVIAGINAQGAHVAIV